MSYKQKCFFCEYKTTRKDSFHRHLIAKHSEKKEKDTLCSVCGQVFFLYIDLKLHIDQKHPTKHECTHCEYKTNHKNHFNRHVEAKHLERKADRKT